MPINVEHCIIFDQLPAARLSDDCDCACPTAFATDAPLQLTPTAAVESHPQLRRIALVDGYFAVYVPSLSRVSVVNGRTLALIDGMAGPTTLAGLARPDAAAAEQLLCAGALRVAGAPAPPPARPDELVAWLHVTNACNLRCTYCYVEKSDEAMDAATAFAAVDAIIRSAGDHGYSRVALKYAGGEASLNLALVEQAHRYACTRAAAAGVALRGVVLSNGVGLSARRLELLKALGLDLMVSLDGPAVVHDAQRPTIKGQPSFAAALKATERAQALGLSLVVSVTVTGAGAPFLGALVGELLARGLRFNLNFYRETSGSASLAALRLEEQVMISGLREAYRAVEQNLPAYSLLGCLIDRGNLGVSHDKTCAVGENYLVVDHRGGVARCQMELARTVTTVWAPDPLQVIRLDPGGVQNLSVDEKPVCRSCEWKYWCTGGCALATYRATGRYDLQSPNCAIYRALYPEVIRLEGLRLLKGHRPRAPLIG